jgi:hypothetical protein
MLHIILSNARDPIVSEFIYSLSRRSVTIAEYEREREREREEQEACLMSISFRFSFHQSIFSSSTVFHVVN